MADISTANFDSGGDSPRAARAQLFDALVATNKMVARLNTTINLWDKGLRTTNTGAANAAIINSTRAAYPNKRLIWPGDVNPYPCGDLDLTFGTPHFEGEGIEATRVTYTGTGTFLNAVKPADGFLPRSPLYLVGIGFDATTKGAKTFLSIKNRHDYVVRNCTADNFSASIKLEMAYIGLIENFNTYNSDIALDLIGDINRLAIRSTGVTQFATYGIRVSSGTFGSIGVVLDNCDIEFGQGACVRLETDDHVSLRDCYLGDGCDGNVFEIFAGQVVMRGGLALYGQHASFSNRLVEFVSPNPVTDERSLDIADAKVGGGIYCGPAGEKMVKGDGKLYMTNVGFATVPYWAGQAAVITGNPIGKRPGLNALTSAFGRYFTVAKTGTVTFTAVPNLTTGSMLVTCTGAGGSSDVVYASQPLKPGALQTYGAAAAKITYRSNADWAVSLSSGAFFNTPAVTLGPILKNTSGVWSTMIVNGQDPLTAPYTTCEISRTNPSSGQYIEFLDADISDNGQMGTPGTLYALKTLTKSF